MKYLTLAFLLFLSGCPETVPPNRRPDTPFTYMHTVSDGAGDTQIDYRVHVRVCPAGGCATPGAQREPD